MARISGVDLPGRKHIVIALQYIYGIGPHRAREICEKAEVTASKKADDLDENEVRKIRETIEGNYKVEGDARRAACSAASWAANGVDLREPLKPTLPDDAHAIVFPCGSLMLTIVLLKLDLMWAWACAMFFFSRRRGFLAPDLVFGTD